ncbi:MAG: RNA methyltransferase [Brevundimonas sp.]|uniref:Class I SAM-dependent RNA methyltransferase n=1 Tax=Brevundimonas albigilva TaxID=1312364 RepID=A0ABY4SRC1_9CAUL|nr:MULTISPECIES: class I SAM-dependent RNA methyltransferase [Brevundimonas]PZU61348.1 MAG: RNA methyltransferase [Brevundimonas sp.]UQV18740.1 class I SAM-dependent RNA methyltransferase [Brevundimonas albigilva]URI16474.1 class I SAM-dependent RNA methyltransferase [Brevundimonas albigilva]
MQTLRIDRMGGQGDGIADTPSGPVFAPLTLPGETVRAQVVEGRAEAVEIVEASPDRIAAVSPQYGDCGGCSLQHWANRPYLAWKREQVRQALARERIETEIEPTVAVPAGSRRRLALHARRGPDGRAMLGFKARRSWRLVEVRECPVADPRIMRAIPALAELAEPLLEHPKSAPTLHVTWTLTGLDVDVTGVERRFGGLSRDAQMKAIAAAGRADLARLSLAGETLVMARQPQVAFGPATVPLPAGGFLQAVPDAEAAMVSRAVDAVRGARKIADLFCGAGTFTFPLATVAPVIAADASKAGIEALKAGVRSAKGLKAITAEARDLFRRPLTPFDLKGCDAVVFDPPRAGAVEQTAQIAGTKAAVVVGVSCNPQTFARDARVLIDAGFRLERATPVDQFLWSAHVELVGIFRR